MSATDTRIAAHEAALARLTEAEAVIERAYRTGVPLAGMWDEREAAEVALAEIVAA